MDTVVGMLRAFNSFPIAAKAACLNLFREINHLNLMYSNIRGDHFTSLIAVFIMFFRLETEKVTLGARNVLPKSNMVTV